MASGNAQRVAGIAATASAKLGQFDPNASAGKSQSTQLQESFDALLALNLPIGWGTSNGCAVAGAVLPAWLHVGPLGRIADQLCGSDARADIHIDAGKILGWLITAFAISLGAQFWFDTLGKIVGLRSSGKKPDDKKST